MFYKKKNQQRFYVLDPTFWEPKDVDGMAKPSVLNSSQADDPRHHLHQFERAPRSQSWRRIWTTLDVIFQKRKKPELLSAKKKKPQTRGGATDAELHGT